MDVPDYILIAGNIRDQYKQLGNGVPWTLGAALGRLLGKAWVATLTANPTLRDSTSAAAASMLARVRALDTSTIDQTPELTRSLNSNPLSSDSTLLSIVADLKLKQEVENKAVLAYTESSQAKRDTAGDDSDVEFLGEQPVAKKARK